MYLVTSYWRGALNISDMRLFMTESEAWAYHATLSDHETRCYLLSDTQPPKLLKPKK